MDCYICERFVRGDVPGLTNNQDDLNRLNISFKDDPNKKAPP